MGAGWTCVVLSDNGRVELEQLDEAGLGWYAAGPGGEHMGRLGDTLEKALGTRPEPAWLALVTATIEDRSRGRNWPSTVLVKQARGTWFHATFSANRESIARHGLDWTRMTHAGTGIAGSREPEAEGVFLCADLESAEWFARMGARGDQTTDIWAVRLDGTWLVGDPNASGGADDGWMICPEPIPPEKLERVRPDNDSG